MNNPNLPWTVLSDGAVLGDGAHIIDQNAWTIANCYGDGAEANARLIITAVNAHAELLAVAKWALNSLDGNSSWTGTTAALKAVIANAEKTAP